MNLAIVSMLAAAMVNFTPIQPNTCKAEAVVGKRIEISIEEQIAEENRLGDIEFLAQLVEAEAGDQGLYGKRLVVDVVLNRIDSPKWPNTLEEVIYQKGQFSVIRNGMFDRAGNYISEESYLAAQMEYDAAERIDSGILYFATYKANGKGFWRYGGHWFSY